MPLLNIGNTTYVAWPLLIASARACSIPPSKLSRAALRPPDFESDVTAGTKKARTIAMMPITMSSSSNVNPPSRKATARRGALKRSTRDAGPRQSRCLMLDVGCWMYSVLVILSFLRHLLAKTFDIRHSFVIRHSFDIRPLDLVIHPRYFYGKTCP